MMFNKYLLAFIFIAVISSCRKKEGFSFDMVDEVFIIPNGWSYYDGFDRTGFGGAPEIGIDINEDIWIGDYGLMKFSNASQPNFINYPQINPMLRYTGISSMVFDKTNILWMGTNWTGNYISYYDEASGVIKYDGTTFTQYTDSNSDLHDRLIFSIDVDSSNNKWLGTENSLIKFDGSIWSYYDSTNSPLKEYYPVEAINNTIWIGGNNSLSKFDHGVWTIFNDSNSSLPSSGVRILDHDNMNNLWFVGFFSTVLWKFDGSTFTSYSIPTYQPQNPDFGRYPGDEEYYCIKADNQNNIWLGGYGKLVKFNGVNWINYSAPVYIPGGDPRMAGVGDSLYSYIKGIVIKSDSSKWLTCSLFPLLKFKE